MRATHVTLTGLLACVAAGGCLRGVNRVHPPSCPTRHAVATTPRQSTEGVHCFLIDGADPLEYANLRGLQRHLQSLGFRNTYHGHVFHLTHMEAEIRRVRHRRPGARFAIVGFDVGATAARELAVRVARSGVPVDVLAYLAPRTLGDPLPALPEGVPVLRELNLRGPESAIPDAHSVSAERHEVAGSGHWELPTRPGTVEVLTRELLQAAGRVPVVAIEANVPPPVPAMPPPRPPAAATDAGEWGFLRRR